MNDHPHIIAILHALEEGNTEKFNAAFKSWKTAGFPRRKVAPFLTFGQWLRARRVARNLSQPQLSETTGYTVIQSRISKIESGAVLPTENELHELFMAMQCTHEEKEEARRIKASVPLPRRRRRYKD